MGPGAGVRGPMEVFPYRVRSACGYSIAVRAEVPRVLGWTPQMTSSELRQRFFGATKSAMMIVQGGAELDDNASLSPHLDVFILTRSAACTPTRVTFREPGRPKFELELPLNSSLASVKAALIAARLGQEGASDKRRRPSEDSGGDVHDCTLIARGKIMSESCLLGDYLVRSAKKRRSRKATSILVLWRQCQKDGEPLKGLLRQHPPVTTPRTPPQLPPPAKCRSSYQVTSSPNGSEEGIGCRPRRSVQRRTKGVIGFSGLKRGARCGLGILPLSVTSEEVGAGRDRRQVNRDREWQY